MKIQKWNSFNENNETYNIQPKKGELYYNIIIVSNNEMTTIVSMDDTENILTFNSFEDAENFIKNPQKLNELYPEFDDWNDYSDGFQIIVSRK